MAVAVSVRSGVVSFGAALKPSFSNSMSEM
jgi:hypothetical protein